MEAKGSISNWTKRDEHRQMLSLDERQMRADECLLLNKDVTTDLDRSHSWGDGKRNSGSSELSLLRVWL